MNEPDAPKWVKNLAGELSSWVIEYGGYQHNREKRMGYLERAIARHYAAREVPHETLLRGGERGVVPDSSINDLSLKPSKAAQEIAERIEDRLNRDAIIREGGDEVWFDAAKAKAIIAREITPLVERDRDISTLESKLEDANQHIKVLEATRDAFKEQLAKEK